MVPKELKKSFLNIIKLVFFAMSLITFNFPVMINYKYVRKSFSPTILCINIWFFVNKAIGSAKERNLIVFCIAFLAIIGVTNVLCKVLAVSCFEKEIEDLFKWIEKFYLDDDSPAILTKIKNRRLEKTVKFLNKFVITSVPSLLFLIIDAQLFYYLNDIQQIEVPFVSKRTTMILQSGFYFSYFFLFGVPVLCFAILGFILIGILRIFNEAIGLFEDDEIIKKESILFLHKLNCEIYEKFKIYEKIFSFAIFTEISLTSCVLITNLVIISISPQFDFYYYVFFTMALQMLIYCSFGQFIALETERIHTNFYMIKWYDLSQKDEKIFLQMLTMASKPFGFKAAGIYHVNFMLFVNIVKMCYTYYAILYAFI
uniref:Odorant receptor n=1 Tax=Lutzomyia longipalpis TaxID=7200 RepID=A0A3F2ZDE3_LUTLO